MHNIKFVTTGAQVMKKIRRFLKRKRNFNFRALLNMCYLLVLFNLVLLSIAFSGKETDINEKFLKVLSLRYRL